MIEETVVVELEKTGRNKALEALLKLCEHHDPEISLRALKIYYECAIPYDDGY